MLLALHCRYLSRLLKCSFIQQHKKKAPKEEATEEVESKEEGAKEPEQSTEAEEATEALGSMTVVDKKPAATTFTPFSMENGDVFCIRHAHPNHGWH